MLRNDGYGPPPPTEWLLEAMKGEWAFGRLQEYWNYVVLTSLQPPFFLFLSSGLSSKTHRF